MQGRDHGNRRVTRLCCRVWRGGRDSGLRMEMGTETERWGKKGGWFSKRIL